MRPALALPLLSFVALSACMSPPPQRAGGGQAQRPPAQQVDDVTALEGAQASQASMGLRALGYRVARNEGDLTYWRNDSAPACAEVLTENGVFEDVEMVDPATC